LMFLVGSWGLLSVKEAAARVGARLTRRSCRHHRDGTFVKKRINNPEVAIQPVHRHVVCLNKASIHLSNSVAV
jgi:hypothetical protein